MKSSERLFRRLFALLPFMIKSFSSRQRLHFREPALHDGTIVKRVPSCKAGSRKCNLCLEEKLLIMKGSKANNLLNKRSELFTLCKHITNSHVT